MDLFWRIYAPPVGSVGYLVDTLFGSTVVGMASSPTRYMYYWMRRTSHYYMDGGDARLHVPYEICLDALSRCLAHRELDGRTTGRSSLDLWRTGATRMSMDDAMASGTHE